MTQSALEAALSLLPGCEEVIFDGVTEATAHSSAVAAVDVVAAAADLPGTAAERLVVFGLAAIAATVQTSAGHLAVSDCRFAWPNVSKTHRTNPCPFVAAVVVAGPLPD